MKLSTLKAILIAALAAVETELGLDTGSSGGTETKAPEGEKTTKTVGRPKKTDTPAAVSKGRTYEEMQGLLKPYRDANPGPEGLKLLGAIIKAHSPTGLADMSDLAVQDAFLAQLAKEIPLTPGEDESMM